MVARKKKHRGLKITGGIIGGLIAIGAIAVGAYCYDNLHYDDDRMDATQRAGFTEKQAIMSDGSTINYAEGPDNGTPLLLIHGQQTEWETYYSVLPQLAQNHHVYAIDCYGHGQSAHDPSLYSCVMNSAAVIDFIRTTIGQPIILSGHSSGGVMAAYIAAQAPALVTKLVLEDPPLFEVTPQEMQEGAGCFAWKDNFQTIHDFLNQNEETDWPTYYAEHGYLFSLFGNLQDKAAQWTRDWRAQHPTGPVKPAFIPHSWLETFYYNDDYDLRFGEAFYDGSWMEGIDQAAMLQQIECPVVYIKANTHWGPDGTVYAANDDDDAQRVQDLIPECTTIRIESGHGIHNEHPDAFIAAFD